MEASASETKSLQERGYFSCGADKERAIFNDATELRRDREKKSKKESMLNRDEQGGGGREK